MYTIVDLCLLCLKKWKILENILSEDSNGVRIEEKLKNMCALEYIDPGISKQICLHCLESLNYSYAFKQQCVRNIVMFNSYIKALNNTVEPCTKLEVKLINISNLEFNQEITKNESSNDVIKAENLNCTEEPCSNIEEQPIDIKNSELNQEIAINDSSCEAIKLENLNSDNVILKIEQGLAIVNEVKYEIIGEITNLKQNHEIAINRNEAIKLESLDNVTMKIEKEESIIVNDEVNYEDINDENLEEKQIYELLEKDTIKNENTDNVSTVSTLDTVPKSSGETIHKCIKCNKTFPEQHNLLRHKRRVHNKKLLFECKICDKKFTTNWDLEKHTCVRNVEKTFKCEDCPKRFFTKLYLNKHKLIHTAPKSSEDEIHKCIECDKIFPGRYHLLRHKRRVHIRLLKCELCDKKFCTRSNLDRHTLSHAEKNLTWTPHDFLVRLVCSYFF